jgi:aryl-alcohol dehydrogenase-like predicted oxidoreductase
MLDSVLTSGGVPTEEEVAEIARVLDEHGVTLYDTAEGYGFGESEKRVTHALRGLRHRPAVVMTKFMPTVWRWTRGAFFESLRRSTDRLGAAPDVYFIHTPVHPRFLQWVDCAFEAKRRGLVGAVGLSNCAHDDVAAALRVADHYGDTIAANQVSTSSCLRSVI